MKQIAKGILVILATLLLFGVAVAGTQDELREHLDGKQIVYNGVCYFKKDGGITFSHKEMHVTKRCVVGMELPDQTKHYILLIDEKGAKELLLYNEKDKSQKSIWRAGSDI